MDGLVLQLTQAYHLFSIRASRATWALDNIHHVLSTAVSVSEFPLAVPSSVTFFFLRSGFFACISVALLFQHLNSLLY